MKVFELIGLIVLAVVIVSFFYIQDEASKANIQQVCSDYDDRILVLNNQSRNSISNISALFNQTIADKVNEINNKTLILGDKDIEIENLTETLDHLQDKYDGLNGTITARILLELKGANWNFRNFTKNYFRGVQMIADGEEFLDRSFINFEDARNTTNQTKANSSQANFTNASNNFTVANISFNLCKDLIININLTDFINHYTKMLSYATNLTSEMIQATSNITNTTNVLRHWNYYNTTYTKYMDMKIMTQQYIWNMVAE